MAYNSSKRKQRTINAKNAGICLNCEVNICKNNITVCDSCSVIAKNKRLNNIKKGLCSKCNNNPLPKIQLCEICFYKSASYNFCKTNTKWILFRDLLIKQNYRCAITGEILTPGDNCSLDHILPISLGGNDDINNCQWVSKSINFWKLNRSHEQVQIDLYNLYKLLKQKYEGDGTYLF